MWVKMKSTYTGGVGTFPAGHRMDIADDLLKHIPEDCYEKSCPPWEDCKDPKAVKLYKAQKQLLELQAKAEKLQTEADQAKWDVDALVSPAAKTQAAETEAKDAAEKAIKQAQGKNATDDEKRLAVQLATEHSRRELEDMRAKANLNYYIADAGLKHMDAVNAKAAVKEAEKIIAEMGEKAAKKKKQAEAAAKAQATKKANAETKATAKAETKAKAEAERHAKARAELDTEANAGADKLNTALGMGQAKQEQTDSDEKEQGAGQASETEPAEGSDVTEGQTVPAGKADE